MDQIIFMKQDAEIVITIKIKILFFCLNNIYLSKVMIDLFNEKIRNRLNLILKKYEDYNNELESEEINNDINKLKILMKQKNDIEDVSQKYMKYLEIEKIIINNKKFIKKENDADFIYLLHEEIKNNENKLEKLTTEILELLMPVDPNDQRNVIIEIRGAVGGDEANIFAGDLFRMYCKYADKEKWKITVLDTNESIAGGFTNISFMIKGKYVYSKMKFESGSHRVQRIPKTEVKGRVHTSIATVAILLEANNIDVNINPNDLRIDTYRSSGAGGQHVNTTDSAVRILHIPTGIVVTSQDGRSQHDNKEKAMISLRSKIFEIKQQEQKNEISKTRKEAVGSGDRSEKIRTYNYPQNRITDHRIGLTLQKLDRIMEGNLDDIIIPLIANNKKQFLENDNEF